MATALTPTTELDAVNQMLGTILEAPLNTLTGVTSADGRVAISVLSEVNRAIQSKGLHYNTEKAFPLVPDAFNGEIVLPFNCLSVDSVAEDTGLDVTQRGNRLYDRRNHSYTFTKTVKVDMTVLLPFEDLPEPVRRYIAMRACKTFQARNVGSTTLAAFTAEEEKEALFDFKRCIGRQADHNIFNSPDMQRMLRRR